MAPIDDLAHQELDRRLKTHLGIDSESELLDALGCDFFYLPARDLSQREDFLPYYKHTDHLELTETDRTRPLGIRWRREVRAAKFSVDEAICGPLQDTTDPQDVLRFPGRRRPISTSAPCPRSPAPSAAACASAASGPGSSATPTACMATKTFSPILGAEPTFVIHSG